MLPPSSFSEANKLTSIEHSRLLYLCDAMLEAPDQAIELLSLATSAKEKPTIAYQYLIGELKLSAFSDVEMLKFSIHKMKRSLV